MARKNRKVADNIEEPSYVPTKRVSIASRDRINRTLPNKSSMIETNIISSIKGNGISGLKNIGNSCYM
jgi:ubiquitin C-terminal hydrolase